MLKCIIPVIVSLANALQLQAPVRCILIIVVDVKCPSNSPHRANCHLSLPPAYRQEAKEKGFPFIFHWFARHASQSFVDVTGIAIR